MKKQAGVTTKRESQLMEEKKTFMKVKENGQKQRKQKEKKVPNPTQKTKIPKKEEGDECRRSEKDGK